MAGVVTHRQHPETAHGAVFVNLEDETGHVNVVFSRGAWARWKPVARHSPVLLIRGRLQLGQGTVNLTAERVEALAVGTSVPASRDFRVMRGRRRPTFLDAGECGAPGWSPWATCCRTSIRPCGAAGIRWPGRLR